MKCWAGGKVLRGAMIALISFRRHSGRESLARRRAVNAAALYGECGDVCAGKKSLLRLCPVSSLGYR